MRIAPVVLALGLVFGLFCGVQAQEQDIAAIPGGGPGLGGTGFGQRMEMLQMLREGGEGEAGLGRLGGWRGPTFLIREKEALGLSQEQVDKLKTLRLDMVRQDSKLRADLRVGELELHDLLDGEQVDMPKVEAKVRALGELRTGLVLARIKARVEAAAVLSAEQKDRALKLGKDRPGRMFHRFGRGLGLPGAPGVPDAPGAPDPAPGPGGN
ncbi:periplasmic heavy metal sensor [bacterium]|nr:periplasmic heavy metal sensor [bacterium]